MPKRKKLLFFVGIVLPVFLKAQNPTIHGKVLDFSSNEPLSDVAIQTDKQEGTFSDSTGRFSLYLSQDTRWITFSLVGFESRKFRADQLEDSLVVYLKETATALNEVRVIPSENPAWRIVRKVQEHEKDNNPLKFREFQAQVYTKVKMQLSDVISKDTSKVSGLLKPAFADSNAAVQEYLNLFLLENAGNFYFRNGQRKEVVKYSISNLPKVFPVNLLVSNEQNPLGFYQPFFRLALFNQTSDMNSPGVERNYVNPFKNGTFGYYDFELTDTLITGKDSVFTMRFMPIGTSREAMLGEFSVTTDGWALTSVCVRNADSSQSLSFEISQEYDKVWSRWYPVRRQLSYTYVYETQTAVAQLTLNHYQEFRQIADKIADTDIFFDGSNKEITQRADTISYEAFGRYRFQSLKEDEILTYERAELKERPLLKKGADFLELPGKILTQAAAPIGPFLLILDQNLMNFHEFARLGLGIQRNLLEYPRFGFRASAGYGLKDQSWKYHLAGSWHLTKDRYNRLNVYRIKDIRAPGQVTFLGPNYSTPYPQYLYFNREGYLADRYTSTGVSLFVKPVRWTWFRLFAEKQQVESLNYSLNELTTGSQRIRNLGLMMRFARKEIFVRNGFFENVQSNYFPIFHVNLKKSEVENSGELFYTFNFDVSQRIRWKRIGYDMVKLEAGQSWGDIPYNFLFNNLGGGRSFFGLQRQGFVTGNFLDYVSNRYLYLDVVHHFGKNLIKTKSTWFQPQVGIGHRYSFSILDKSSAFERFDLNEFRRGQGEINLYLRNLAVIPVFGFRLGLGIDLAYNYSADFTGKRRWAILPAAVPAFF